MNDVDRILSNSKKVLVAMSGGVDSAIAAYKLIHAGYQVSGAMMKLYDNDNFNTDLYSAQSICENLDIDFKILDFSTKFENDVINYFVNSYCNGYTPNPCIACNKHLKFGAFLNYALDNGFDFIATGHYVHKKFENGKFSIYKGTDPTKDQSYVVYFLNQQQLQHILFPLGDTLKSDAKKLAMKLNLVNKDKAESQDICFIKNNDYGSFIRSKTNKNLSGVFCDTSGHIIAKHTGIYNYTIGQRKGLGISLGKPSYVCNINTNNNNITIGDKNDLKTYIVYLKNCLWIDKPIRNEFKCFAKIRYNTDQKECYAEIDTTNNCAKLIFDTAIYAVSPGQIAVLYDNNSKVLGGGTIKKPADITAGKKIK